MLGVYYYRAKPRPSSLQNEKGATAVEYCIMAAAIAAVVTAAVITLGLKAQDCFIMARDGIAKIPGIGP